MGDEEQRPVVNAERALELLDRGEIQMVRGLVEDEAAGSASALDGELRARPLAGRQAPRRAQDVLGIEVELRQQGPRLTRRQARR